MFDRPKIVATPVAYLVGSLAHAVEVGRVDGGCDATGGDLSAVLSEASSVVDALQGAIVAVLGQFRDSGAWSADGSLSVSAWLVANLGMSKRQAGALCRTASLMASMPFVTDAAKAGTLPYGHLVLLTRARQPEVATLFERDEPLLVGQAHELSADALRDALRRWYLLALEELATNEPDGKEPGVADDALSLDRTFGGRGVLHADLTAESTALVADAIDAELAAMHQAGELVDDGRTMGQRRAVAFLRIIERGAPAGSSRGRPRPSVVVTAPLSDLFRRAGTPASEHASIRRDILGGGPVAAATVRRLLCSAEVSLVITDLQQQPLWLGRTKRHADAAQWSALIARGGGTCEFPDCDAPHTWCVAHHLLPFEHGGTTDIDNLAMVCGKHHRAIHELGYQVRRSRDGDLTYLAPGGNPIAPRYRPTP